MTDNDISKLRRMVLKGEEYREDYELEYFGETITIPLRPLTDPEYTQLMGMMNGMYDEDELQEQMDEIDDVENIDELDEDELVEDEDFDTEFTKVMIKAAEMGVDHDAIGETQEGFADLLDRMVGGVSFEIGAEVMEITTNLQEAERFRRDGGS